MIVLRLLFLPLDLALDVSDVVARAVQLALAAVPRWLMPDSPNITHPLEVG